MIFDHISNLGCYAEKNEKLAVIAEFLSTHPADTLVDGRHELPEGIYVNVSSGPVRDDGVFEVHRRYADLQLVIEGSEIMEWAHLSELSDGAAYNAEGDYQLFSCQPSAALTLKVCCGYFAVFYPQDGHKASLRLNHDVCRKAVFKIPIDQ